MVKKTIDFKQAPVIIGQSSYIKSRKGFALILVLWILSLLTIMAGSFALTMRRESSIIAGIKNNAGAAYSAEAGIAVGQMLLLHPDQNKRWRADGNIYQVNFGETRVRIRMLSESGKIDINKADQPMLQNLMEHSALEEEKQAKLIGAIIDWRDGDDLKSLEGAEKDEYRKAGLKYQPRNKPFQSLEELQMVLGMDEKTLNWLQPLITIYSGQAQVNTKVASAKVLKILPGVDADLLESYLATRLENAKTGQPTPDFAITLPGSRVGAGGAGGLGGVGAAGGETITIVSEALLPDATGAMVEAIVQKANTNPLEPYKILKWQRNPINQESLFTEEMSQNLVNRYAEAELRD